MTLIRKYMTGARPSLKGLDPVMRSSCFGYMEEGNIARLSYHGSKDSVHT